MKTGWTPPPGWGPLEWTPTGSTEEAMALLELHRAQQLATGRLVADLLIKKYGETTGQLVLAVMRELEMLDKNVKDYWVGALFRVKDKYKWTGKWVIPELPNGSLIHAQRPVKVWTFYGPGTLVS
jgi:hypothetical protein